MGFDVNRFVGSNPINEDLICNICKGVLEDGVWSPNCEHAFCKGMSSTSASDLISDLICGQVCIQQWIIRRSQCPNDRQPLNLAHLKPIPRFMRNLLDKLEIRCDFVSNGCQLELRLEALREHIMVCDFNPDKRVDCEKGCGIVVKKVELPNHSCIKALRRALDNSNEEQQRLDRIITRFRSEVSSLKNENIYLRETNNALEDKVNRLEDRVGRLEDRQNAGIAIISQPSSSSASNLSSTSMASKSSRVVPNPYVLITPLQSSSPIVSDEPSSSTLITGSGRLANEEPAFKRRTTTIRVASPLHSVCPFVSTPSASSISQSISQSITHSNNQTTSMSTFSTAPYSPAETMVTRSPSPRFLSTTVETIPQENDSNTAITVSDSFAHSYNYIALDAEPDFEDNEETGLSLICRYSCLSPLCVQRLPHHRG